MCGCSHPLFTQFLTTWPPFTTLVSLISYVLTSPRVKRTVGHVAAQGAGVDDVPPGFKETEKVGWYYNAADARLAEGRE